MLIFGILSVLLILSMIAFNVAQSGAKARVVDLRADSAATRVAGIIVQTSLIAERQGKTSTVTFLVDLPQNLEGLTYQVKLLPYSASACPETPTVAGPCPAHVTVSVPATLQTQTAALFSADAAATTTGFDLCTSTVAGGRVNVRLDARPATLPAGCPAGTNPILFLESAP